MKNKIKNIVVAGILCFGVAGLAHGGASSGGHSHNVPKEILSEERIIEVSQKYIVEVLVKNQKVDSSWKNSTYLNAKKQNFNNNLEWVVKFQNLNIKDSDKQSLFIFVDLYGTVSAANYSGK
ncbi:MAG: DUF6488 family protein [Sulfurimonas sp.]|nr:DUF6488 family protein [Sulfurimonas sp.]